MPETGSGPARVELGHHAANPLLDELGASRPTSVPDALEAGRRLGRLVASGRADRIRVWEALATLAADDLGAARAIEPHLDAVAILLEAGRAPDPELDLSWGVFAAEGPGARLTATRRSEDAEPMWTLEGVKPWCSLAGALDRALVTAWVDDRQRGLFAVDLTSATAEVVPDAWHARGLAEIPSGPVRFHDALATAVGAPGWYLERPGFAWGGIGVAACWHGGAVGIARALHRAAAARPERELTAMHLGAADEAITASRLALEHAARQIDAGEGAGRAGRILAARVRGIAAAAAETVLRAAAHGLGPAPLAQDAVHAKRVADLSLYIRQHHAEADQAALGRRLADEPTAPW